MARARAHFRVIGLVVLSLALGCSQAPQAAPQNLRLIASLRTALSTKNDQWLAQNEKLIEDRRRQGQMSEEEYRTFTEIVAQAKAGDWEEAEQAAVAFQRAQRPKQEYLDQLPSSES